MGEVHELIRTQGVDAARQQAATKHRRQCVETAFQVLSDEAGRLGFSYTGFALTSLPHKPTPTDFWLREEGGVKLVVQAGRDADGKLVGLPFGAYARFILLFLQSEAVRNGSREIELGRNMRIWLGKMNLPVGGKTYRLANEQARRISHCTLSFHATSGDREMMRRCGFVTGAIYLRDTLGDQPSLWQERALLDETFYRVLREHPVPVSEAALRGIGSRSLVLDIYIWLAYRLHVLTKDAPISWLSLHKQFGLGFNRQWDFRKHFIEALEMALAAYPEARVSVGDDGGSIILHPSRPPIPKL